LLGQLELPDLKVLKEPQETMEPKEPKEPQVTTELKAPLATSVHKVLKELLVT
jgi:hypothetical protein